MRGKSWLRYAAVHNAICAQRKHCAISCKFLNFASRCLLGADRIAVVVRVQKQRLNSALRGWDGKDIPIWTGANGFRGCGQWFHKPKIALNLFLVN